MDGETLALYFSVYEYNEVVQCDKIIKCYTICWILSKVSTVGLFTLVLNTLENLLFRSTQQLKKQANWNSMFWMNAGVAIDDVWLSEKMSCFGDNYHRLVL